MTLNPQQVMNLQLWIAILMIAVLMIYIILKKNNLHVQSIALILSAVMKKCNLHIKPPNIRKALLLFLFIVAIIACINYFYISRTPGSYIHRWDMFHTYMGTKYYDELGYTKLYECAVSLDARHINFYENLDRIRELSTLKYISAELVVEESDCEVLFSKDRKNEFINDLKFFNSLTYPQYWNRLFRDKGYNGSPFYTYVLSKLVNNVALSYRNLILLAMIDIILILVSFYFVYRAFGIWTCLIALIFFCVNFPARFVHMGGSILRFDYIAYLIIGLCFYKLKSYKISGLFLALSAMLRIFPIVFAVGLGLKALVDLIKSKKIERKYLSFFAVFFSAMILFFILSLTIGQGLDNWHSFIENMQIHNQQTAGFRIGFKHIFMFSGEITEEDPWVSYAEKQELFENRIGYFYASIFLVGLLLLLLMPFMKDEDVIILFGTAMFFFIFASTRYYYAVLVLLFLLQSKCKSLVMLMLYIFTAIALWVYSFNQFDAFIYNYLLSFILLIFFIITFGCLIINHRKELSSLYSAAKPKIKFIT